MIKTTASRVKSGIILVMFVYTCARAAQGWYELGKETSMFLLEKRKNRKSK